MLLPLALLSTTLLAQGTQADYDRSAQLDRLTSDKVYRQSVRPHWLPGGTQFWYRNDLGDGKREFVFVDAASGTRSLAFDHPRLAEALGRETKRSIDSARLPFDAIEIHPAERRLYVSAFGKQWEVETDSYRTREAKREPPPKAFGKEARSIELRPTRQTGEETEIVFVNGTAGPIKTYWVNDEGEQRFYSEIAPRQRHGQHTFAGHVWLVKDAAGQRLAVFEAVAGGGEAIVGSRPSTDAKPETPRPRRPRHESPNGRFQAVIREHNVFVRDLQSGQETRLSQAGSEQDRFDGDFHWAPDSRKLVVFQTQTVEERKIRLIESSPRDQLQPKLHELTYVKPGDPLPQRRPRLFDVVNARQIPVPETLFENAWSVGEWQWSPDASRFTFLFNQRGHQVLRLLAVDATSGEVRSLIEERSPTFIDYAHKFFLRQLDDTREVLWMSERDGWNHLYLFDAEGRLKGPITRGEWVVRGVEQVDIERRQIWFRAGGIRPEQDPYHVHLARVNFDGGDLTIITAGDGTHRWEFSPDRRFVIDTWSRVDQPPVTELRRAEDGGLVCELERADATELLATGWRPPERFVAPGRDGRTPIYGLLIRPTNFDPQRRYPVIEEIYAGPHGAFVPKGFDRHLRQRRLAELGFIVVQCDGMGTSFRSKAFHDVCWRNLGDSGFPDRIAWLRAAAKGRPELDLTRVGIYGGSAGGQSALRALLAHGDFYHAAVADCGCHDNRMDKIWWNELWMGWPIGPHYADQSNVTQAHRLTGKLMLVVGELDRNVDPASTMQVANALVKANKDFDLLLIPGAGHGAAESPYASRRRMDFFVRHLWNAEPRR